MYCTVSPVYFILCFKGKNSSLLRKLIIALVSEVDFMHKNKVAVKVLDLIMRPVYLISKQLILL